MNWGNSSQGHTQGKWLNGVDRFREGQMPQTLSREIISTRQRRLAELASEAPGRVLTTLAHHIDLMWLEKERALDIEVEVLAKKEFHSARLLQHLMEERVNNCARQGLVPVLGERSSVVRPVWPSTARHEIRTACCSRFVRRARAEHNDFFWQGVKVTPGDFRLWSYFAWRRLNPGIRGRLEWYKKRIDKALGGKGV